jgi:methionyl aminopeptidase
MNPAGKKCQMIVVKSEEEIRKMREAGRIVAGVLDLMEGHVAAGVATERLDRLADDFIRERGGVPSFLGYQGFPRSICTSINEVVVHGIPDGTRLNDGDIIGIDVGVIYQGYHADAARTYVVGGDADPEALRLVEVTRRSLESGISRCVEGNFLGDVSHAIQSVVERAGFSVVVQFVGHGIGRSLHEDPQIPNYGKPRHGPRLAAGMTFALEPMVNQGDYEVEVMEDGWTVKTKDRRLSAHFEHTVVVGSGEPLILTLP